MAGNLAYLVWSLTRRLADSLIRQHLARAVDRMKKQADKRRSEREFVVGTSVYMKLQPYVQSFVLSVQSKSWDSNTLGHSKSQLRLVQSPISWLCRLLLRFIQWSMFPS
jgi:hypothetical protein